MINVDIHKAQISILRTLRKCERSRYTDLRLPTGLESDVFKFHLRRLIAYGFIKKDKQQHYILTPIGKEFANNLDDEKRTVQKQPKLSLLFVPVSADKKQFIFQQRKRQPFYNYWGLMSGPAQRGVDFLDTAKYEFEKQTGLTANYEVSSFMRQRDYETKSDEVLEDKLFIIVRVNNIKGVIKNSWKGGFNKWMTLDELESTEKFFPTTRQSIDYAHQPGAYVNNRESYQTDDY